MERKYGQLILLEKNLKTLYGLKMISQYFHFASKKSFTITYMQSCTTAMCLSHYLD